MTQKTRSLLEWIGAAIAAGVFAAGAAYGATKSTIDGKLDTQRFTLDSAYRAGQQTVITETLQRLEAAQRETNERLREIVCPPGARGCR